MRIIEVKRLKKMEKAFQGALVCCGRWYLMTYCDLTSLIN